MARVSVRTAGIGRVDPLPSGGHGISWIVVPLGPERPLRGQTKGPLLWGAGRVRNVTTSALPGRPQRADEILRGNAKDRGGGKDHGCIIMHRTVSVKRLSSPLTVTVAAC